MDSKIVVFLPETMDLKVILEICKNKKCSDIVQIHKSPLASAKDNHYFIQSVPDSIFENSVILVSSRNLLSLLFSIKTTHNPRICVIFENREDIENLLNSFKSGDRCLDQISQLITVHNEAFILPNLEQKESIEKYLNCNIDNPAYFSYNILDIRKFKSLSNKESKRNIDLAWVGPLYGPTLDMIHIICKELCKLDDERLITFHIIGPGRYAATLEIKEFSPRIKFAFCGNLEEENLEAYLHDNVDIIFSYSDYAVNCSGFSIPTYITFIRPPSPDNIYLISDLSKYSMGDNLPSASPTSISKIISSLNNKSEYLSNSEKSLEYYNQHVLDDNKIQEFREMLLKTSLTLKDLLTILATNSYVKKQLRFAPLNIEKFEQHNDKIIKKNQTIAHFCGDEYNDGNNFPLSARVKASACITYKSTCRNLSKITNSVKKTGYSVLAHVFHKYIYSKAQHSYPGKLKRIIEDNKGKRIKVAFINVFKTSFPLRGVFEKMCEGSDFDPYIIIAPNISRSHHYKMQLFNDAYKCYSEAYGERVIKGYDEQTDEYLELGSEYPIVVFCNPYKHLVHQYHGHEYFLDKDVLMIYANYGYAAVLFWKEVISTDFYNQMWKVCIENDSNYQYLKKTEMIHGHNGIVTGYAKMDKLAEVQIKPSARKKILICPHHTVWGWEILNISNFLKYKDLFVDLPSMFPQIDFIFRPHPLLFPNLKEYLGWSQKSIDEYLQKLLTNPNMTYSTVEDYSEEFMTSDAMIHDCASFTAEYLFTNKPCCYMIKSEEETMGTMLPFGKECLENYYHAKENEDIVNFIQSVVIEGNDPMKEQRTKFVENKLRVNYPHVASTIVDILKSELKR